jgi:hypothetical protein
MSLWRSTVFTVTAGLVGALLLGRLAGQEQGVQERRSKIAVMAPHWAETLSDDNLADAVAGLRITQRITRVGWDYSILSVDLAFRGVESGKSAIWEDVIELIRFSFSGVENVRQLLIRVYRETSGTRTLLFYGDSRRADWTSRELTELRPPDASGEEIFLRKIRLTATPAGNRKLRNLAN